VTGRPSARRATAARPTRRSRPVRRASNRITPTRVVAAFVVALVVLAIYGVTTSGAFDYTRLRVEGNRYTKAGDVEATLAGSRGQNLFRLETRPLEDRLEQLPTVARARVGVELPDTLAVRIDEREPILVWGVGDKRFLVDSTGTLFAVFPSDPPAAAGDLPVVNDRRAASAALDVGATLDPVDLDASTRLGSLVPNDVGSEADHLAVTLTDENGYVIKPRPGGWSAVFGFYTPTLRSPGIIPGQVRLLRSLLIGREPLVDRVILANETDGTYTTKPTPKPSASPGASASPP
jgi:cell division septal protein FtsQ